MIIKVGNLTDNREVLAGRSLGRKALTRLIAELEPTSTPTVCFLDFAETALVTGSFFAEFVVGFSRHVRALAPNLYPVLVLVDEVSLQELELLASTSGEVIPVCSGTKKDHPKGLRLIGSLDIAHSETLKRVEQLGPASAKSLAESAAADSGKIGLTGWHNRLTTLSRRGLIIEDSCGRQKLYRALNQGA